MNLFVGNLSKTVNDAALKALFSKFGEVTLVKVLVDRYTGESKGCGFVDMASEKQAQDAIRKLTNVEFFGRRLAISKARPKDSAS